MRNVLSQVLFVVSVASIVVAIALSGGSLGKSVKWNLYDSITYFCDPNSGFEFKLYGYQTLWSSYDAVNDDSTKYLNVYLVHAKDSWRTLARILVIASLGVGFLTLCTLMGTMVPILKGKPLALNAVRIVSSMTSAGNGALLIYTLYYYHMHYPLMKHDNFNEPTSCYPDEDNVSTGFYMTAFASFLYFTSAVLNVVNMTNLVQNNNAANVAPTV